MVDAVDADLLLVAVDRTYLERWKKEQALRARARRNLPASWRDDPRPEMESVVDGYVELITSIQGARLRVLPSDDR